MYLLYLHFSFPPLENDLVFLSFSLSSNISLSTFAAASVAAFSPRSSSSARSVVLNAYDAKSMPGRNCRSIVFLSNSLYTYALKIYFFVHHCVINLFISIIDFYESLLRMVIKMHHFYFYSSLQATLVLLVFSIHYNSAQMERRNSKGDLIIMCWNLFIFINY